MNYKLALVFFLFFNQLCSRDWINPGECDYSYIYAPGLFSTETQLAKYCPEFIASTGELVTCVKGVETVQANVSGCTFAEVNLSSSQDNIFLLKRLSKVVLISPLFLYLRNKIKSPYKPILEVAVLSSLLGYVLEKNLNYAFVGLMHNRLGINIQANLDSVHSLSGHYANLLNLNVGQDNDINICKVKVEEHLKKQETDKDTKVILYGISRGSATVFNYFALHDSENIAAMICEGIFDSLANVAYYGNLIAKLKIKALNNIKITNFKVEGICPLACVNKINKDKPIALITSFADEVVPFQCTLNLYKKLKERGCKKVHLLILKTSTHNIYGTNSEKEIYQNFIHAFYKNYDLPYIEKFAHKGQEAFNNSQPDLNSIDTLLAQK